MSAGASAAAATAASIIITNNNHFAKCIAPGCETVFYILFAILIIIFIAAVVELWFLMGEIYGN